jgi:hypothetical protein
MSPTPPAGHRHVRLIDRIAGQEAFVSDEVSGPIRADAEVERVLAQRQAFLDLDLVQGMTHDELVGLIPSAEWPYETSIMACRVGAACPNPLVDTWRSMADPGRAAE